MADPDRSNITLEDILEATRDVGGEVKLLRQEFTQHSLSDNAHFGELKESTRKHTDSIHDLQLWRAGLAGQKAGAAPWLDSFLRVVLPLVGALLMAGAAALVALRG